MRTLGIHTYAGGMQVAIERSLAFESEGSVETWKPALKLRRLAGLRTRTIDENLPLVDLVYANPPCSRFSHLSSMHYSDDDRSNLSSFPELIEIIDLAIRVGASAVWWETGPMAARSGLGIIEAGREALQRAWDDDATSLIVPVDTLDAGIPQKRPRTHVVWRRGKFDPPIVTARRPTIPALAWVDERVDRSAQPVSMGPSSFKMMGILGTSNVIDYVSVARDVIGFNANRPRLVSSTDAAIPAILSSRLIARADENRWFTLPELASFMGYPAGPLVDHAASRRNPLDTVRLLAKNVSTAVTALVGRATLLDAPRGAGGTAIIALTNAQDAPGRDFL